VTQEKPPDRSRALREPGFANATGQPVLPDHRRIGEVGATRGTGSREEGAAAASSTRSERSGGPGLLVVPPIHEPAVPAVADPSWGAYAGRLVRIRFPGESGVETGTALAGSGETAGGRGVTFDLTGLPPDPANVDAFSPRCDRRMPGNVQSIAFWLRRNTECARGRHWLDVARYADSNGLDETSGLARRGDIVIT